MMNPGQAAIRGFRGDLARLLAMRGWKDEDLAWALDCTKVTISRMRKDPGRVKSIYVLTVQELLRREEEKLRR